MSIQAEGMHGSAHLREKDSLQVRLIFTVCFVPSLIHVVVMRCLHGRAATSQSIISEAKAAAYTCVSFAFMG